MKIIASEEEGFLKNNPSYLMGNSLTKGLYFSLS